MDNWLKLSQETNPIERFAHQALSYGLIAMMLASVGMVLLGFSGQRFYVGLFAVGLFAVCLWLIRQQHLQLSAQLLTLGLWTLVTVTVIVRNGINNAFIFSYLLILVYSSLLLLPSYWLYLMSVLSIASVVGLGIGERMGILPLTQQPYILIDREIIIITVIAGSSIMLILRMEVLKRIIDHIQYSEQQLIQHNLELESLTNELRQSEGRYRLLFESMAVPCIVYDRDGTILLLNQATADVIGKPMSEVLDKNLADVIIDGKAIIDLNAGVFDTGKAKYFEGEFKISSQNPRMFRRHVIPLPDSIDDEGNLERVLTITTDITDMVLAEKRIQELELAQAKVDFYDDFFGAISHDIKNPLTVINSSLYLLKRSKTELKRDEKMAQIAMQVKIIEAYIQDMLMISRLEHIPTLELLEIDLKPLISDIVGKNQPKVEKKAQQITITTPDELRVTADFDQLKRLLTNLIENAINYTSQNGTVAIEATADTDTVRIRISDTGIGIGEEDIPYIFDRFYRADAAKTHITTGTGLGLAIVKRIVELHEGTITVDSTIWEGTTFSLSLPYRSTDAIIQSVEDNTV